MNRIKVKLKHSLILLIINLLFLKCLAEVNNNKVKNDFHVWGPGLEPHNIVMPARYFHIISLTNNKSIGQKDFSISIEGGTALNNKPCRIWSNILDRKNGSLIVRYKVYESCTNIKINIKYNNKYIGKSPYIIKEIVHPDDCYCPKKNLEIILGKWDCKEVPLQIKKNLEQFGMINWDNLRPKIIEQFDKPHSVSICHYIIKENQIYRKCYGKYVGFNMFSDSILLSLIRKVRLPNLEFFVNLGDWPLSLENLAEKYPILSWCGSSEAHDIIIPTYELTESALENMGKVILDILSVQGNSEYTWKERESKLFWRGRDSNRFRLSLIKLSRDNPELINASLTNFFFYRDEEHIYGPKSEHVSFFKFFDYKYQLAIDGTVAPYRTPFLLAGGSLVFKPKSKYFEHFYNDLKPNVHYIPIKTDLSDLIEQINWAQTHDEEARQIALNAQNFANENLLPQHVFCYYFHLFNELSKITSSKVEVLEDMELVSQKKAAKCDCKDSIISNNKFKVEL